MKKWVTIKDYGQALNFLEKNISLETFMEQKDTVKVHIVHLLLHTARNGAVRRAIHEHFNVTVYCKDEIMYAEFKKMNMILKCKFDWSIWTQLYKIYNGEEMKYEVEVINRNYFYNGVTYELLTKVKYLGKVYYVLEKTFSTLHDKKQVDGRMFTVVYKKNSLKFNLIQM